MTAKPPFAHRHFLVVEDDEIVTVIVAASLRDQGAKVTTVTTITAALAAVADRGFDMILADVNLPDGLGFDLARLVRQRLDCPILYLTTRGEVNDRVRGLDAGGDDYIVKPVELEELAARIRAVLRRCRPAALPAPIIAAPGWTVDLVRRELATTEGMPIPLTRGEFDLFSALVQAKPVALDREYLQEVISSADAVSGLRAIDVMVSRIRAKLAAAGAPLEILTVRGGGYRFVSHPDADRTGTGR